jgi:hypothetical protein
MIDWARSLIDFVFSDLADLHQRVAHPDRIRDALQHRNALFSSIYSICVLLLIYRPLL